MEVLVDLDKSLFVFLNSLGNKSFDFLWLIITDKKTFIPLYIFLIYCLIKNFPKSSVYKYLVIIFLLILFTDQISGLFKDTFQRLRPCHDLSINDSIRIVKSSCGGLYGFFSAHASNTFALATFFYLIFKNKSNLFKLLFIWAFVVSYSRIYVGVHFPSDIVVGASFGIISGYLFNYFSQKIILND